MKCKIQTEIEMAMTELNSLSHTLLSLSLFLFRTAFAFVFSFNLVSFLS